MAISPTQITVSNGTTAGNFAVTYHQSTTTNTPLFFPQVAKQPPDEITWDDLVEDGLQGVSSDDGPSESTAEPTWLFECKTAREKVRFCLKKQPHKIWTTKQLWMATHLRYNAIRKAVLLLERDGEIVRDPGGRGGKDLVRWGNRTLPVRKIITMPEHMQKPRYGYMSTRQRQLIYVLLEERVVEDGAKAALQAAVGAWQFPNAAAHAVIKFLKGCPVNKPLPWTVVDHKKRMVCTTCGKNYWLEQGPCHALDMPDNLPEALVGILTNEDSKNIGKAQNFSFTPQQIEYLSFNSLADPF